MNLANNCYNTELYEILEVVSLDWAIKKRSITFFKQLMENPITKALILTRESSKEYILNQLEIGDQGEMGTQQFTDKILQTVNYEIKRIDTMSHFSKVLRSLWMNRDRDENEETLELLFKSKNNMRKIFEDIRSLEAG
jgi:hypothetical protein